MKVDDLISLREEKSIKDKSEETYIHLTGSNYDLSKLDNIDFYNCIFDVEKPNSSKFDNLGSSNINFYDCIIKGFTFSKYCKISFNNCKIINSYFNNFNLKYSRNSVIKNCRLRNIKIIDSKNLKVKNSFVDSFVENSTLTVYSCKDIKIESSVIGNKDIKDEYGVIIYDSTLDIIDTEFNNIENSIKTNNSRFLVKDCKFITVDNVYNLQENVDLAVYNNKFKDTKENYKQLYPSNSSNNVKKSKDKSIFVLSKI